jgi:hypothetical protein
VWVWVGASPSREQCSYKACKQLQADLVPWWSITARSRLQAPHSWLGPARCCAGWHTGPSFP